MNLTSTLSNMLSSSFKNRISPSFILRCWYSPRRVPVRTPIEGGSQSFDNFWPDDQGIAITDTSLGNGFPSEDTIRSQCQSLIQKTSQEWEDKKAQEKESYLLPSQKEQRMFDIYCENIRNSDSVEEVFRLYKDNFSVSIEEHYIIILEKLAEFTENGIIGTKELHDMITFKTMLFLIWKRVRTLTNVEIMEILEPLTVLKVSTNSLIIQSFLQMLKFQINYMDGFLLLKLHNILSHQEDIPLVVALREAIIPMMRNECQKPIAFSSQTDTLKIIEYCSQNNVEIDKLLDDVTEVNLVDALASDDKYLILCEFLNVILLPSAESEVGRTEQYESTVNFLLEHLAQDEGKETCLRAWDRLAPRLKTGLSEPLSETAMTFLDQIYAWSQQTKRWNYQQSCAFQKDFVHLAYVNTTLVNDVIKGIAEDAADVTHDVIRSTIIAAFVASTDSMDNLIQNVISKYDFSTIQYDAEWLHVAVILLLKEKCPEQLLHQLFSGEYLSQCLADDENLYDNVLNLNRIRNLLPPTSSVPISAEFKAEISAAINDFPFQPTIFRSVMEEVMKKNFIPEVLSTKDIHINFLMAVDNKKNRVINIMQNYTRKVIFMKFPPKTRKFAVLEIPSTLIFKPSNLLAASIQADVRILTEEGYTIIYLNENLLNDVADDILPAVVRELFTKAGIRVPKLEPAGRAEAALEETAVETAADNLDQYRLDPPQAEDDSSLPQTGIERKPHTPRHKLVIDTNKRPKKAKKSFFRRV